MLRLALAPAALLLAACGAATADGEGEAAQAPASEAAVATLAPSQLAALLERGEVRLIDVRRDDEVAQGIIAGAEHVALDRFDPAALDLSDGREVVVYCRSGRRSAIAAQRLAEHTGRPARHLAGGILAWQEDGRTLTRP